MNKLENGECIAFNTFHQQGIREQTQSLMDMGRGYLTAVGPWMILVCLMCAGSQGEKTQIASTTCNIESWWGKIVAVMGEIPAAMWSFAVLCGRSEEIKKRGNSSLLCWEHPLSLPWQCGQSGRQGWPCPAQQQDQHWELSPPASILLGWGQE